MERMWCVETEDDPKVGRRHDGLARSSRLPYRKTRAPKRNIGLTASIESVKV